MPRDWSLRSENAAPWPPGRLRLRMHGMTWSGGRDSSGVSRTAAADPILTATELARALVLPTATGRELGMGLAQQALVESPRPTCVRRGHVPRRSPKPCARHPAECRAQRKPSLAVGTGVKLPVCLRIIRQLWWSNLEFWPLRIPKIRPHGLVTLTRMKSRVLTAASPAVRKL